MSAAGDQFALDLRALVAKVGERHDMVVRKILFDMSARIIELSPVGDPELWASNAVAMMNRESYRNFMADKGKKVSATTLKRNFPTHAPKGYVGGRFRANWQYGIDSAPTEELYSPKDGSFPGAPEVLAAISSSVADQPTMRGHVHYVVNNLPYAQRLEDGWSSQAPAGMVALTVTEFQSFVDDAVKALP